MTIRFGVSPIAWINDDMPELGGDTPLESVLRDIQEVGFSGKGRLKDSLYGVQFAKKLGRQSIVGDAAVQVFNQMVEAGMGDANDSEVIDALRAIAQQRR